MARWSRALLALAAAVLLAAPSAFAQGGGASSTGSISGEVKDEQGGVLPGVTVTATSPAAIGTQTAVTNEAGIYRFPAVPPGEYALTYELAGFGPVTRDGIRITLGFNAQVNVTLRVASLQETVTVSGESPVIDTTATRLQTNFDQQQLASLPNARDMWSLLATTPSVVLNRVDVGGATMGTQTTYFAYGYSGQNRPLIEGINTTEGTAAAGFYLDYGSFEEVFIGAAGNSAEMPSPGVLTQFVGKSGSNQLGASLYFDIEDESIQSRNLSADQIVPNTAIRADGNRLASYKNLNVGVGGPVLRDKIWARFDYLNQRNSVAAPPSGSFLDGTPFNTKLFNYTGKVSYQMNQNNKFIAYLQHGTKQQPNRTDINTGGAPIHITADSTTLQDSPSWVYKGEWNGTIGQNMFAEVPRRAVRLQLRADQQHHRHPLRVARPQPGAGRRPRLDEQAPPQPVHRRGELLQGQLPRRLAQPQVRRRVPRRDGQHHLEPGLRRQRDPLRERRPHRPALGGHAGPGAPLLQLRQQERARTRPASSSPTRGRIKRMTINVGLRYDRYNAGLPEQSLPAGRFTGAVDYAERSGHREVQPHRAAHRRHLRPAGRRQARCSRPTTAASPSTPASTWPTRSARTPRTSTEVWPWQDLDGDRIFDDNEKVGTVPTQKFGGVANTFLADDLENSYTDEASAFVERPVITDLGVRVGFVWKKDYNGWQQTRLRPSLRAPSTCRSRSRSPVPTAAWPPPATTPRSRCSTSITPPPGRRRRS